MKTQQPTNFNHDERLGKILAEWLETCERGETPDVEEYIGRYPEFAAELREHIADWQRFPRVSSTPNATPKASLPRHLGDHELLHELGRGGMGVVYEARQISLDRRVALKVLLFAASMDAKQLQRFHNEARAAAALEHPHIVPVYGIGCERGVHYYAMRLIEGKTLAALIAEQRPRVAPKPTGDLSRASTQVDVVPTAVDTSGQTRRNDAHFRRAAEWGRQAAEAIEYAHSLGVVHRDIKPANLMIDSAGKLWVTDFGLARTAAETGLTLTGDLLGTLRYMSPEQALAKHGLVDHRTDVYALGATLYELITGQPAVEGQERREILHNLADSDPRLPSQWNRAIPRELETIILKALSKEPAARYATAQEMADDLANFLEDRPIQARRPTHWQRTKKWCRRHQGLLWSTAASALLIVATAVTALTLDLLAVEEERQLTKEALVAVEAEQRLTKIALDEKNIALAQLEIALRDRQKALEEKDAALQRVKAGLNELATSYHNLGYRLGAIGDGEKGEKALAESLSLWEKLVKEDPDNPQFRCGLVFTRFCRGVFLAKNNQWKDAEQTYRQALVEAEKLVSDFPDDKELLRKCDIVGILHNLSLLLQQKGGDKKLIEALKFREQCLQYRKGPIDDFDRVIYANWISLLRQLESHKDAVKFAETALAKAPKDNNGPWLNVLGIAQFRARDRENSLTTLERAWRAPGGENSFNSFPLAMVHWQLGNKDEAKRWYDRGTQWMEMQPRNEVLERFRAEAMTLLKIQKKENER